MALADDLDEAPKIEDLRDALYRAQKSLRREKDKTDALVAATTQAAHDAALSAGWDSKPTPKPKSSRKNNERAMIWHLTDWQGGKKTTSYDSQVMEHRINNFLSTAKTIQAEVNNTFKTPELQILFGGDMIEGLFNYPTQPYEIDSTLFAQYVNVSRVIATAVREALSIFPHVTVHGEWGNHGRLGSKRDAVPRSDNADRMTYELARALLQNEKRLTWEDSAEDIQRVEIGEYRALLMHGDEIGRGGYASPMTIVRHADRWASGAYPWKFRDVYVGHYHTHAEWPMANGLGAVYQTGSTESDNRYARETMAASASPSQRIQIVDPVRGRVTTSYKVDVT